MPGAMREGGVYPDVAALNNLTTIYLFFGYLTIVFCLLCLVPCGGGVYVLLQLHHFSPQLIGSLFCRALRAVLCLIGLPTFSGGGTINGSRHGTSRLPFYDWLSLSTWSYYYPPTPLSLALRYP